MLRQTGLPPSGSHPQNGKSSVRAFCLPGTICPDAHLPKCLASTRPVETPRHRAATQNDSVKCAAAGHKAPDMHSPAKIRGHTNPVEIGGKDLGGVSVAIERPEGTITAQSLSDSFSPCRPRLHPQTDIASQSHRLPIQLFGRPFVHSAISDVEKAISYLLQSTT